MTRYLALLILLPLTLVGCSPQENRIQQNGAVYCVDSAPTSMNPQLYGSGSLGSSLSHQVYDRLLTINPLTQRIEGGLASRWSISRDGLTYQFTLRKGVKFHTRPWFTPTRDMNADDVLFSFNRMLQEHHPFHEISGGSYPFFDNTDFREQIREIRKEDDQTISFILNSPNSAFQAYLASDYAVILSAEYADKLLLSGQPEQIDTFAIGTGPFMQQQFRNGEYIRLLRHEQYWDVVPGLERLAIDYTPKATKRLAKLITGECQVMSYPAATQVAFIKQHKDLLLDEESGLNTTFISFNTTKKPLSNLQVRQALSMAVNRDNILQAVYFQTGEWASSLLPPVSWGHNPNLDEISYDPVAAKQLLKQAGLADGFDLTLWVQTQGASLASSSLKIAQLIQGDLARIGVNVRIVQLRWPLMRSLLQEGKHDMVLMSWSADTADPDNFFRPLLSCRSRGSQGFNYSRWCDSQFDSLLEQANRTSRLAQRIDIYQQMQSRIQDQLPLLPLAHAVNLYASWKRLHNLEMTSVGGISFKHAYRD